MKNIQVIDGATNCTFSIYQIDDFGFSQIFPEEGQDVEFVEDFFARVGEQRAAEILSLVWKRRMEKSEIMGLHGTLFYGLEDRRDMYPNKQESDLD